LQFATHLPAYVYRVSFRSYKAVKVPVKLRSSKKVVFGAPDV